MGKYSGTDGSHGKANMDLTVEHTYKVDHFLGWRYGQKMSDERYGMVVRKDTRRSSYMFEYFLVAGLTASDADVYPLHVTTTPNISYVVHTEGSNCGTMISTNHNPLYDNGVKVINEGGEKLEGFVILEIEECLDGETAKIPLAKREHIDRTVDFAAGQNRYIGYLISTATHSFENMKVTLDYSNGSASTVVKNAFDALGAEIRVMNNGPNGLNINTNYGFTHTEHLQKFVMDKKCDIGFAHNGDADRCITVGKNGCVVDGDSIICICGRYMKEQGSLFNNAMVTIIMSNFGLYEAFDREGIAYVKATVRDKHVYKNMAATGRRLGGRQSGHIILSKYVTTGDGIPTSLKMIRVVLEKKQPLDELTSETEIYSQVLKNMRVKDKKTTQDDEAIQAKVARVIWSLDSDGRTLLQQLGTESVVRVMVRAPGI